MKRCIFFIILVLSIQGFSQENPWTISFAGSYPFVNIQNQLKNELATQNFDGKRAFIGTVYYPTGRIGFSGEIEVAKFIKPQKSIGIAISLVESGKVTGVQGVHTLDINYSQFAFNPFIQFYSQSNKHQLKTGLSLNTFQTTHNKDTNKEFRIGGLLEGSASIVESNDGFFVRAFVQGRWAGKSKIGPFTKASNSIITLPDTSPTAYHFRETKISHFHISAGIRIGMKSGQ